MAARRGLAQKLVGQHMMLMAQLTSNSTSSTDPEFLCKAVIV
jgi:hypothetical protein